MINGIIYKITCLVNRKCYIGQTFQTPESRWKDHIRGNGNTAVHNAIQKYGIELFRFEVLHTGITCRKVLNALEIVLIAAHDSYRNGYNQHSGGQDEFRCSQAWQHAAEICRLYTAEFKSLRQLAERYDTTWITILEILKVNGIERRDKSYVWEHAQEICDLYTEQNQSTLIIGNMFGVSDGVIGKILKANGISVKSEGRYKGEIWKHAAQICHFYAEELLSYQKISDRYGTNSMQIRRVLEACGVELRKYSPRKSPNTYQN